MIERNKYDLYLGQKYPLFGDEIKSDDLSLLVNHNVKVERDGGRLFVNKKYPVREKVIHHLVKRINHLEVVRENKDYKFASKGNLKVRAKNKILNLEIGDFFHFSQQFLLKVDEQVFIMRDTFVSDDLYRNQQEKFLKRYQSLVALFNTNLESVLSYKLNDYIDLNNIRKIKIKKILKRGYTLYPAINRLVLDDTDESFSVRSIHEELSSFGEKEWFQKVSLRKQADDLDLENTNVLFLNKSDGEVVSFKNYQQLNKNYGNYLKISSFPELIFEYNHKLKCPYMFDSTHWRKADHTVENQVQ